MNFIYDWQLKKAYQDFQFYDSCMTFVLHFMPFTMILLVQHMMDTFLTLTNFDYLTKHITLKLFPFLCLKGAYPYYLLLVYLPE